MDLCPGPDRLLGRGEGCLLLWVTSGVEDWSYPWLPEGVWIFRPVTAILWVVKNVEKPVVLKHRAKLHHAQLHPSKVSFPISVRTSDLEQSVWCPGTHFGYSGGVATQGTEICSNAWCWLWNRYKDDVHRAVPEGGPERTSYYLEMFGQFVRTTSLELSESRAA